MVGQLQLTSRHDLHCTSGRMEDFLLGWVIGADVLLSMQDFRRVMKSFVSIKVIHAMNS
ncbi:hypothetical protein X772_26825 [Mesorhizobium sp. LSJC280B00]|nr:hypothetical protein X772_26825 [Mesorhizobium sp. LSJC280B00]